MMFKAQPLRPPGRFTAIRRFWWSTKALRTWMLGRKLRSSRRSADWEH